MIASDLITNHVPPVKSNETIEKALFWMDEFRVNHLPVLEGKELVGVVSEVPVIAKTGAPKVPPDATEGVYMVN